MEISTFICILTSVALGFFAGIVVEMAAEAAVIRDLQAENRKLKLEAAQLKKAASVEVIEIKDNRAQPESYFAPF